jgi:hypothetical protein
MTYGKAIVNDEREGIWQEAVVIYPDVRMELLRKTKTRCLRPGLQLFECVLA